MPKLKFKQHKLRKLSESNGIPSFGVTIPTRIAKNFKDTYFFIDETKYGLILTSGARCEQNG